RGPVTIADFAAGRRGLCVFEHVYLASVASDLEGVSVYASRERMGETLADEHPVAADVVIPVPDSAIPAAVGYARRSGIPFREGLIKNRYIGRTFIQPSPELRRQGFARLPVPRRHGERHGGHHRRALHSLLHRRLSRAGTARAREGLARGRAGEGMSLTYRDAGVNVARAEDALSRVKDRIARTRRPEVIGEVGQFGGLFASPGADKVLVATTDGVGTKLELARLLDRHEVVGADLVHHCVNDALAMGAEPLFFLDYFATSKIDPHIFARVVGAMADACARFGTALLGGETAEMPGMYAADSYDLAGFLVGVVDRAKILGPERAREGDALVGIPSTGLHTNGYSLAREICTRRAMHERSASLLDVLLAPRDELEGATLGSALLAVHRPYLTEFRALRDVADVHSIAHVTG